MFKCQCCGEMVELDTIKPVNGFGVCSKCYRLFTTCPVCGLKHMKTKMVPNPDGTGELLCSSCVRNTFTCPVCGKNRVVGRDYENRDTGERHKICVECYTTKLKSCSACGHTQLQTDLFEHTEGLLCGVCNGQRINKIHEHSFVPETILHGVLSASNPVHKLRFGVELEVQLKSEYIKPFRNQSRRIEHLLFKKSADLISKIGDKTAYIKRDGSVSNGFEIVTHPGTLAWHTGISNILFPWLKENEFCNGEYSSCGMHIHLDRKFFQDVDGAYRLICFFEHFQTEIQRVSNRKSNYAVFLGLTPETMIKGETDGNTASQIWQLHRGNAGKYAAVNTQHKQTYEIRTFKSTLDPRIYLGSIEFLVCAAHFCHQHSVAEMVKCSWEQFTNFAFLNFPSLKNLSAIL